MQNVPPGEKKGTANREWGSIDSNSRNRGGKFTKALEKGVDRTKRGVEKTI